jgi:S1-C subfamily serine protease
VKAPAVIAAVAGLVAGVAAAVVTLAVASSSGAFDGTQTVISAGAATVQPVNATSTATGFDAGAIYRARIGGVVTITSLLGSSESGGSGFVVSSDGLIMTNAHVVTNSADGNVDPRDVKAADQIYVRFAGGDQVPASMVGFDLFSDVAVIRVQDGSQRLRPVPLGDSAAVRVGEPVAAIGSPFLEAGSLSVGVVSAINRSLSSGTGFAIPGAIQTDAAINHGNSGGPLFDAAGQVVGINAQIQTTSGGGEGVGFAVPIDLAKRSLQELVQSGQVQYGWMGVRLSTVTPELADRFGLKADRGALVVAVTPNGPADRAGLREGGSLEQFQGTSIRPGGDVIVSENGHRVVSSDQFIRLVDQADPGDVLHLRVVRAGDVRTVDVTLGVRPL